MSIFLGHRAYELCRPGEFRVMEFQNPESALRSLSGLLGDPADMASVRNFLSAEGTEPVAHLSDQEVLKALALRLVSGRVFLVQHRERWHGGPATEPEPAQAASVESESPRRAAREAAPQAPEEQPVLPADLDSSSMAEASQRAARDGTAVCEVCQAGGQP